MIPVFGSDFGDTDWKALKKPLDRQWTGMGEAVSEFEQIMAARLGCADFVMTDSGSNALWLALESSDLKKGGEVILPAFTWLACANAICLAGMKPVFCDVDASTGILTAESVRSRISPQTVAIMPVHYAGLMADMDALREFGLPLIEDAAHAVCSTRNQKYAGTFGLAGVFSFDSVKNLASSEAGGIAFQNKDAAEKARKLRYCGIGQTGYQRAAGSANTVWWETEVMQPFPKMLPDDLAATLALSQLKQLDLLQEKRKNIFDRYQAELLGRSGIEIPRGPAPEETHSYFTWLGRFENRDALARHLLSKDIYTTLRYWPLHFNSVYGDSPVLPATESLARTGLNLPLHPRLSEQEQDHIIRSILSFVG